MFTQFPCNICVFGLSCAGSYLCVFVLFCVLVFFLFLFLFFLFFLCVCFSFFLTMLGCFHGANHVVNALPEFALCLMDRGRFTPSVYKGASCLRSHFHRISP